MPHLVEKMYGTCRSNASGDKDRPGSLFQPGPGPGPGSAKSAGTGILPGPGL